MREGSEYQISPGSTLSRHPVTFDGNKKIPPGLEEEMWSHSNKVLLHISHK